MKYVLVYLLAMMVSMHAADSDLKSVAKFIKRYTTTTQKELNKLIESKKTLGFLSYDLLNNVKVTIKELKIAAVSNRIFEKEVFYKDDPKKTLAYYVEELRNLVEKTFAPKVYIIIEQYPIYHYKKPPFKDAKYDVYAKNSALTQIKNTKGRLEDVRMTAGQISNYIKGLADAFLAQAKLPSSKLFYEKNVKLYKQAADFADKISELAGKLATEIGLLKEVKD